MSGNKRRLDGESRAPECLAPAVLLDFHRRRLSRPERKNLRRHLRRCPDCRRDSRFVAIIVRDENRLLRSLKSFIPGSGAAGDQTPSRRAPRSFAAAVSVAAILLAFFILPPGRHPSVPGFWTRAYHPEPAAKPEKQSGMFVPQAVRLSPKSGDIRERLVRSGHLRVPDFGPGPVAIPDANRALASFEISQKRDRGEELFGWSLPYRPEAENAYPVLSPR